jgi:mono/diheme cytochrome c family protein
MRRLLMTLACVAACRAQDGIPSGAVDRGAQLYRVNCATPYCHGPEGGDGRAPRLIGHHLSVNGVYKAITWGIPGTGMPEFTTRLKTEQIGDLVAYVMTLSSTAPARTPVTPPRVLSADAKQGRALFFDTARVSSCGSCHELDGWGTAAAPDIARAADLRAIATRRVVTVRPAGEAPFPALVVERSETRVRVYDLSAALPVLRSFAPGRVAIQQGGSWRHELVTRVYTAREMELIGAFLRAVSGVK